MGSRVITPALRLLQVDLTDECPLFCAHCSNSSGPARTTHFPIKSVRKLLDEACKLGLEKIVFSGGEPLRYPHLEEALSASKASGIPTTIFTTGIRNKVTRLPISMQDWRNLSDFGLGLAAFSVYAAPVHREYHNAVVRSVPTAGDSFGANEQAISDARAAGIAVDIHFIPSGKSAGDLPEIHSWAAELGCSVLHLQIPTYQGRNKERPFLELNSADETRLKQAAHSVGAIVGNTRLYVSRFWSSRWNTGDSDCIANLEQLIIRTDGTISPCNACKYGSVTLESENVLAKGGSLGEIWRHSRVLQELRDARGRAHLPTRCEGVLATVSHMAASNA